MYKANLLKTNSSPHSATGSWMFVSQYTTHPTKLEQYYSNFVGRTKTGLYISSKNRSIFKINKLF